MKLVLKGSKKEIASVISAIQKGKGLEKESIEQIQNYIAQNREANMKKLSENGGKL